MRTSQIQSGTLRVEANRRRRSPQAASPRRPSLEAMPARAALTWAPCSRGSRSNVRQCMPLGLQPLPLRMPGSHSRRDRRLPSLMSTPTHWTQGENTQHRRPFGHPSSSTHSLMRIYPTTAKAQKNAAATDFEIAKKMKGVAKVTPIHFQTLYP